MYVARQQNERWTHKRTFWYVNGKRRRGKQKTRWRDEIDRSLGHKIYHRVAYDRREWERLGEAFARWLGQLYELYEIC